MEYVATGLMISNIMFCILCFLKDMRIKKYRGKMQEYAHSIELLTIQIDRLAAKNEELNHSIKVFKGGSNPSKYPGVFIRGNFFLMD